MLLLGLIFLVIGVVMLATANRVPEFVGMLFVGVGVILILVDVLELQGADAAAIAPLWLIRHDASRHLENALARLVPLLPAPLRRMVVVDAAVQARMPDMRSGAYCGPDGLTYGDLYDGASQSRGVKLVNLLPEPLRRHRRVDYLQRD